MSVTSVARASVGLEICSTARLRGGISGEKRRPVRRDVAHRRGDAGSLATVALLSADDSKGRVEFFETRAVEALVSATV